MTITLVLDFYDDRLGYQVSGGGIFYGGSDGYSEKECIKKALHEMEIHEKDNQPLKIIRNEHRASAKLDSFF